MIILEDKLRDLVNTLPDIVIDVNGSDVNYPIYFDFGSDKDLNKYLKQKEKRYPLIWLETGFSETQNEFDADFSLNLIIVTYALSANYDNNQRLELNFKNVLIPLVENIVKGLQGANNMSLVKDVYKITKFYNYGDGDKHGATDFLDAIKLEIDVNITNECFKQIFY